MSSTEAEPGAGIVNVEEIRSAAAKVVALNPRHVRPGGYRPSFASLPRARVTGPVLFPIPGAAERQKQPFRLPRWVLPATLSAAAASVTVVELGRLWEAATADAPGARATSMPTSSAPPSSPVAPQAPPVAPEPQSAVAVSAPILPVRGIRTNGATSKISVTRAANEAPLAAREPTEETATPDPKATQASGVPDDAQAVGAQPVESQPGQPAKGKRESDRKIDDLLASVISSAGGESRAGDSARAHEPDLPPLARDDIVAVLKQLRPRMKACSQQHQQRGLATVRIEVGKAGEVVAAAVSGPPFAGTPAGECVEAAVKAASFPSSAGMTFQYPFRVR